MSQLVTTGALKAFWHGTSWDRHTSFTAVSGIGTIHLTINNITMPFKQHLEFSGGLPSKY